MTKKNLLETVGELWPARRVLRCEELAPDIFYVELDQWVELFENDRRGIIVIGPYTGNMVSLAALLYGKQEGRFIFSNVKSPVGYELLRQLAKYDIKGISDSTKYTFATECCAKYLTYFGEVPPPPSRTPFGPGAKYIKICPGVYFIEAAAEWCLAVSFEVWRHQLTNKAVQICYSFVADQEMDLYARSFIFFKRDECALALFDLLKHKQNQKIMDYLTSVADLGETLWAEHENEMKKWNNGVEFIKEQLHVQEISKLVFPRPVGELRPINFLNLPGDELEYVDVIDVDGEEDEDDIDDEGKSYILEHYDGRWGDIFSILECANGVYVINQSDSDIPGHYIIPLDYAGDMISEQALAYGIISGELRYFDQATGAPCILYELLRSEWPIADEEELRKLAEDLAYIACILSESYEDYFGEVPPPPRFVPGGEGSRYLRAHRGLYFIEGPEEWFLAVGSEAIKRLSEEVAAGAVALKPKNGTRDCTEANEWRYFRLSQCARPIQELLNDPLYHQDLMKFGYSVPKLEEAAAGQGEVMTENFLRLPDGHEEEER